MYPFFSKQSIRVPFLCTVAIRIILITAPYKYFKFNNSTFIVIINMKIDFLAKNVKNSSIPANI